MAAANDLFETEATRLIASIASRKRDLEIATKAMNSVTEDLHKSESDLKFEKIIETLQVSSAVIEELKDVREDLTNDEKAILDKAVAVAKTADEVQKLVKQVWSPRRPRKAWPATQWTMRSSRSFARSSAPDSRRAAVPRRGESRARL